MPVVPAPKKARPDASSALLTLMLEFVAVGVFAVLAGASDDAGTLVVLMMVGFWLIYMVTESSVIAGIGNALAYLTANPSNK